MSQPENCPNCGHSLLNNTHGPDQNDYDYDVITNTIKHCGSCSYCSVCFPRKPTEQK